MISSNVFNPCFHAWLQSWNFAESSGLVLGGPSNMRCNLKYDHMNIYSYMRDVCDAVCVNEKAVKRVRSQMLNDRTVIETAELFKVLSDPTRMRLVYALAQRELCVCDLSAVLEMTQSAVSHQLRILRSARLVNYRREGRVVYYSLADAHVVQLINIGTDHARESQPR